MLLSAKELFSRLFSLTFILGILVGCVIWSQFARSPVPGDYDGTAWPSERSQSWLQSDAQVPSEGNLTGPLLPAGKLGVFSELVEQFSLKGEQELANFTSELVKARASLQSLQNESRVVTVHLQDLAKSREAVQALSKMTERSAVVSSASLSNHSGPCTTPNLQYLMAGVVIEGPCACVAGGVCTFHILDMNQSHFDTAYKIEEELIVFAVGPSRAVAQLQAEHFSPANAAWTASFRLWDAGQYQVSVQAGCTAAKYLIALANFTLVIEQRGANSQLNPCTFGQGYRWLRNALGEYDWTNYPCAPPLIPLSDYAFLIRRKGFKRLVFVGDSHQRGLYLHTKFLLGAPLKDNEHNQPHIQLSDVVNRGDPERELQMLFVWVDG
jgi:hypothetical protein